MGSYFSRRFIRRLLFFLKQCRNQKGQHKCQNTGAERHELPSCWKGCAVCVFVGVLCSTRLFHCSTPGTLLICLTMKWHRLPSLTLFCHASINFKPIQWFVVIGWNAGNFCCLAWHWKTRAAPTQFTASSELQTTMPPLFPKQDSKPKHLGTLL